jgi:uncharacterized protein
MTFKLVIDTNFYYSAIGFDNVLYRLLFYLIENINTFKQYASAQTIKELEIKLHSEKFAQKTKNKISKAEKDKFINLLAEFCVIVKPTTPITICRDPKDNMFLELAQEVGADYLITGDNDLLVLKEFSGCKIVKPSEFITELGL